MVDLAADAARYRAFLSYSHTDAAAAGRLHRALESYRMPKRLVGTETARGPVLERLTPIFRDRDELPAATDLSEQVRVALAESAALIILCSPAAASSRWVAEEIRTFRGLHPDRPILAAIVAGEPSECFPEPLCGAGPAGVPVEPLATDLRPIGDGPKFGLLKLVAGITGVDLDSLVQRDATRRVRRITAVTAVAVAVMLVMAGLTVTALDAQRDADDERSEVARQIEFLLTDLRGRLKDVGRLDVQMAVNRHALDYYSRQRLDDLAPESLEQRARALLALGEDFISQGELAPAASTFEEARRTTEEQLRRAPDERGRIFAHAQSEYWTGRVHELRSQWAEASRHYGRYAAAAARLLAIAPNDPDYMMEAGHAAINQGSVAMKGGGDARRAQPRFEEGLRWFERVERIRPGDEKAMSRRANAHAWLADIYLADKLFRRSLAERIRQHDILLLLHRASPQNRERRYELGLAQRAVGRLEWLAGEPERAFASYRAAYDNASELSRHDAQNADWLLLKAMIECDLSHAPPAIRRAWSGSALRRDMAAALERLEAQGNAYARDIARCLGHSEQRQAKAR